MPACFVGRAEDVAALTALGGTAERSSAPAVGLVTGPPGQGKTRLLAEVCARLPGHVVRITGHQVECDIPLAAVGNLLRPLASAPGGALLDRLLFEGGSPADGQLQLFEARCARCS